MIDENRSDIATRNLIRRGIENRLMSPDCMHPLPSLRKASEELHLSERTLIRKLKQLDQSFRSILESERKQYADKLLRDGKYTVFDIADILGYTESASFCRAFKAWFGQSPSAYRRNPKE